MTNAKLSQLTQDAIDGLEDPRKALDLVWPIKYGNPHAEKCFNKILHVVCTEADRDSKAAHKRTVALNSQTPKTKSTPSQWVNVGVSNIKGDPHWVTSQQKQYGY